MNSKIRPTKHFYHLGVRLDQISSTNLPQKINAILHQESFQQIGTINPEFIVMAQHDKIFRNCLNQNTLNLCDGFGIVLWQRLKYHRRITRHTGVEVAELICSLAAQRHHSVFLLGGWGVASSAANYLKSKYPSLQIAGATDGEEKNIKEKIIAAKPQIILVAWGAPRQEQWLAKNGHTIPGLRLGIGVGGSFDFWSGKIKRSPRWLRKIGLEWLWRLAQEPHLRWKRIWRAVIVFSYLSLKNKN